MKTPFLLLKIVGLLFTVSASFYLTNHNDVREVIAVDQHKTENELWMEAINNKDVILLGRLYDENALVMSKNGVDLSNRADIITLVEGSDFVVNEVSTTMRIEANSQYDYEIGAFKNKSGGVMKHLIVWKKTDSIDIRELEFLAEAGDISINTEDINMRRNSWMQLCNAHDAETLIRELYTENTMYYNLGRLLEGRTALTNEYAYMNNPNYRLKLNPILVEPVSNDIVFEFGQCEGSYNGKYVLVWQKTKNGEWQVLFDTNI